MAFTPLDPSANDRSVNLTIPKEKDPYLAEWYLETKRDGENVNSFVLRHLMKLALQYQTIKQSKLLEEEAENNLMQEKQNLANAIKFLVE